MACVEIMLPSARTLPTGKLTQNPIRTGERRCILYVGDDSGITLASITRPSLDDRPAREIEDLREGAERRARARTPVNRSSRPYFRRRRQTDALTNYLLNLL